MTPKEKTDLLTWLHWTGLLPAGMLLFAILPLPYGYYTLLRLVVCGCSIVYAIVGWHFLKPIAILSGILALLFNPLIPIYLDKEAWIIINVIAAVYQLIAWALLNSKIKNPPLSDEVQELFESVIEKVFNKTRDELTEADRLAFYIFWTKEKDKITHSISNADDIGELFNEFKDKYSKELEQFERGDFIQSGEKEGEN